MGGAFRRLLPSQLTYLRLVWVPVVVALLVLRGSKVVAGQLGSHDVHQENVVLPQMGAPGQVVQNVLSQPGVAGADPNILDGNKLHKSSDIGRNQAAGVPVSGSHVPNVAPNQPVHVQQPAAPGAPGQDSHNFVHDRTIETRNQIPPDPKPGPGMVNMNEPSQLNPQNSMNPPPPPSINLQNVQNDPHLVVSRPPPPPEPQQNHDEPRAQGNFQEYPNQPAAEPAPHIPRPLHGVPHPDQFPVHPAVGGGVHLHGELPEPVPQQFGHQPHPGSHHFQGVPHHDQAPDVYNQLRHNHELNEIPRPRPHDENPPDEFVSMTVIVPPGSKNCYFYTPLLDFIVYHQVVRGGGMDIGLRIVDPEGRNVINQRPSGDGKFSITVPGHFRMRPHAVCFDNRKATFGEKYVSVMIDVDVNWDNPSEEDKKALDILRRRSFAGAQIPEMKREYIEGWRTIDEHVEGLYGRLHRIKLLQQRSNNFAAVDKALMESNLSRVSSGSIIQVILMFGVATFQVILIRAFFDPDSRFYRIWFGKRSIASARC